MELVIVLGCLLSTVNGQTTTPHQPSFCITSVPCKCTRDRLRRLIVDCSELKLMKIPRIPDDTVFLFLNNNEIEEIDNRMFSSLQNLLSLDLSHNNIRKIDLDAFQGLTNLQRLDLNKNDAPLTTNSFEPGVFLSLRNLCYLNIQNSLPTVNNSYPDETFADLISLTTLKIDGKPNAVFGPGFSRLKRLHMLSLSSNTCFITSVRNTTFVNLPYLTVLDISHCSIRTIEPGALIKLRSLRYLDISHNIALGLNGLRNASFGLINSSISVLKANKLYPNFHLSVQINREHFEFLTQTNIKEIHLDENQIELVDSNSYSMCPESLETLSVVDNKFTFGYYIFYIYRCKSLKIFHGGYQHTTHIPFTQNIMTDHLQRHIEDFSLITDSEVCKHGISNTICIDVKDEHIRDFLSFNNISSDHRSRELLKNVPAVMHSTGFSTSNSEEESINNTHVSVTGNDHGDASISFNVPPNLEEFHFQFADLRYEIPKIEFRNSSVKFINISGNSFYKLTGPLMGLEKLSTLDISDNLCSNVSDRFFENLKNLKTLSLGNNLLGLILMNDIEGKILGNLANLIVLILSNNQLTSLPFRLFSGLHNLEYLDISQNYIQTLNINMGQMKITYLNINRNLLSSLPDNVRIQLAHRAFANNVTIDMSYNPFECDCNSLEFIKWVCKEKSQITFKGIETYTCKVNDNETSFVVLDDIIFGLEKRCANYTVIVWISSVIMFLFIIVLTVAMMYRYRWKLRYLYFMTMRRYRGYSGLRDNDRKNYQFDAFLSYSDNNLRFVRFTFLPKVETNGLHLCIHHRDFLPGEEIAANISNAIHRSRKTVVLLDDDFLSSYWCMYELNMARMESVYSRKGRNIIIVLLKEGIDRSKLPLEVIDLLDKNTYIELPAVINDIDISDICSRLRDTIME